MQTECKHSKLAVERTAPVGSSNKTWWSNWHASALEFTLRIYRNGWNEWRKANPTVFGRPPWNRRRRICRYNFKTKKGMLISLIWSETWFIVQSIVAGWSDILSNAWMSKTLQKLKIFRKCVSTFDLHHSYNWSAFICLNPATNVFINIFRKVARRSKRAVAYPELVSRGVSKSRKFKWLVKIVASKGVTPLI